MDRRASPAKAARCTRKALSPPAPRNTRRHGPTNAAQIDTVLSGGFSSAISAFTKDEWLKIEEEAAGTTYAVMNVARFFSERDTLVQKKARPTTAPQFTVTNLTGYYRLLRVSVPLLQVYSSG